MDMKYNWIPKERCMVMNLNKLDFINVLSNKLHYSKDRCIVINEILENNFFISKKNKDKIIEELIQQLGINYKEAIDIYDIAIKIIKDEVKEKLKHPFKSQD